MNFDLFLFWKNGWDWIIYIYFFFYHFLKSFFPVLYCWKKKKKLKGFVLFFLSLLVFIGFMLVFK